MSSLSKESSDAETNNLPTPLVGKADLDVKTYPCGAAFTLVGSKSRVPLI